MAELLYKDVIIGEYEADLLIDQKFVVELKAISKLNSSHEAQAMHYLAATGYGLPSCSISAPVPWNTAASSNKQRKNSVTIRG